MLIDGNIWAMSLPWEFVKGEKHTMDHGCDSGSLRNGRLDKPVANNMRGTENYVFVLLKVRAGDTWYALFAWLAQLN